MSAGSGRAHPRARQMTQPPEILRNGYDYWAARQPVIAPDATTSEEFWQQSGIKWYGVNPDRSPEALVYLPCNCPLNGDPTCDGSCQPCEEEPAPIGPPKPPGPDGVSAPPPAAPKPPKVPPAELPADTKLFDYWSRHTAPDGRTYYWNQEYKKSTWDSAEVRADLEELLPGWTRHTNPYGRIYYHHREDSHSTYDLEEARMPEYDLDKIYNIDGAQYKIRTDRDPPGSFCNVWPEDEELKRQEAEGPKPRKPPPEKKLDLPSRWLNSSKDEAEEPAAAPAPAE